MWHDTVSNKGVGRTAKGNETRSETNGERTYKRYFPTKLFV